MAFEVIDELKRAAEGNMWTSPERLCVTADGRVTHQDDPAAVRLLVGKNCQIPRDEARKYGLLLEPGEAPAAAGPDLKRLKKAELQALAGELGLETGGANQELISRIEEARALPSTDGSLESEPAGDEEAEGSKAEPKDPDSQAEEQ